MDDSPEIIRQQMEETKSQISEKLESLETQVSETVQSTGTAVNATVEAVHETVECVTTAVHDAVQSVGNVFDFQRHINRHPWLVLGGSAVLGYLAVEILAASKKRNGQAPQAALAPLVNNAIQEHQPVAAACVPTATAITTAYESGRESSFWHQLEYRAIDALISTVQDIASRAVPRIVDYLAGNPARIRTNGSEKPAQGEPMGLTGSFPRNVTGPKTTSHVAGASGFQVFSEGDFR